MHVLDWIRAHTQRASARHGDSVSVVWNNNNNKNSLRSLCVHVDSHNIKAAAVAAIIQCDVAMCIALFAFLSSINTQWRAIVSHCAKRNQTKCDVFFALSKSQYTDWWCLWWASTWHTHNTLRVWVLNDKKKRNNKNYVLLYGAAAAVYLLSFCACSNSNVSVSLRLSS